MFKSPASRATSLSPSLIGESMWVAVPETVFARSSIVISRRRWRNRNVRSRGGCSGASGGAKVRSAATRPLPRHVSEESVKEICDLGCAPERERSI